MDLHGIVSGAVGTVNPPIGLTVKLSSGYTTADDGTRTPTYNVTTGLTGQVQPLSYRDITQLANLNIQGAQRAIYIQGRLTGLLRPDKKGGDLVLITSGLDAGTIWLVTHPLEVWPDWCKVAVTRQS